MAARTHIDLEAIFNTPDYTFEALCEKSRERNVLTLATAKEFEELKNTIPDDKFKKIHGVTLLIFKVS